MFFFRTDTPLKQKLYILINNFWLRNLFFITKNRFLVASNV